MESTYFESTIENYYKYEERREGYREKLVERQKLEEKLLNAENEEIRMMSE
jgi:hypothetical protein